MHSEARRACSRTPSLLGLDLIGFLAFQHFTTDIAWRVIIPANYGGAPKLRALRSTGRDTRRLCGGVPGTRTRTLSGRGYVAETGCA